MTTVAPTVEPMSHHQGRQRSVLDDPGGPLPHAASAIWHLRRARLVSTGVAPPTIGDVDTAHAWSTSARLADGRLVTDADRMGIDVDGVGSTPGRMPPRGDTDRHVTASPRVRTDVDRSAPERMRPTGNAHAHTMESLRPTPEDVEANGQHCEPEGAMLELTAGRDGRIRYRTLRSCTNLAIRRTPTGVHLVSPTSTPIGGDRVALTVRVGPRAQLAVHSVAASVARRGPDDQPSHHSVSLSVGRGATCHWHLEPLVAAAGCHHLATSRIQLASGAHLWWQDELVAGRHGEAAGTCRTLLTVDIAGRPALRHELSIGPAEPAMVSPAVLGGAKVVATIVAVGRPARHLAEPTTYDTADAVVSVLPLSTRGAVLVSALATDHIALDAALYQAGARPPPDLITGSAEHTIRHRRT